MAKSYSSSQRDRLELITPEMASAVEGALVGYGSYWTSPAEAAKRVVVALAEADPPAFERLAASLVQ